MPTLARSHTAPRLRHDAKADQTGSSESAAIPSAAPSVRTHSTVPTGAAWHSLQTPPLRTWLPNPDRFAHVAIDFDPPSGLFSLLCFRRNQDNAPVLVTTAAARYRLRELEATLVELGLRLPAKLQQQLVALASGEPQPVSIAS
ncbi:MAG: hypothetical protein JWN48_5156 [Myxococcaceae bacterium]|nr:hypothetical protein [Myxococcaceae bacterium]